MEGLLALEIDEDLLATCSALGYTEGDQYYKGDECWECMKDLIRFLRLDQPVTCTVRRQLGQMQTVQKDLLPILVNFHEDEKLLDASIKLLINLTQSAVLCMEEKYDAKDVQSNRVCLELNQYLQQYKQSFTNEKVMTVLGTLLARLCRQPAEDRPPDDSLMVERILLLLRNILHILSTPEAEKRTDDDVDLHDEIIWNFHVNGIDDLLIYICNSSNEAQWMMHGLEIIFLMMREQSASKLAAANSERGRQVEDKDLELLIERERQQRKARSRNFSSRHSHFGGTYVIAGLKALNDSENVIYHRPLAKVESHSLDTSKRRYKVPKRRVPAMPHPKPRQTTLSVRRMLQQFSINFLEYCYNTVMRAARDIIMRQHHLDHDETYYLWAVRFFMEFNRLHDFRVDLVSETLTMTVTNFVMAQVMTFFEKTLDYKRFEARPWSRRLHYALKAYREVLEYIHTMSVHSDPTMRDNADIMQSNLFYTADSRDIFHLLLRNYDQIKSDKDYLRDLIETTHLYMKLIEHHCKKKNNLLVKKKTKRGTGKRKKKRKTPKRSQLNEVELHSKWMEMETKVVDLLQPEVELPEPPLPFDGASGVDVEEQKTNAMDTIVELLHAEQHGEAVAFLRAARTIWPETCFGSADWTVDDERDFLRETLMSRPLVQMENEEEEEDEETGGRDGEEEERVMTVNESEMQFDVEKYSMSFGNSKIVRAYCLLLRDYRQNSSHTNHCIVKMLHCISVQCHMTPMLYHISVFRSLDEILNDPAASKMQEMVQFARYVVSGFLKMAAHNPCMFAELLFWKGPLEVCDLQEGYGTIERRRALKLSRSIWTVEQQEQLAELYHKHKGSTDMLEAILDDLPREPERTRRQLAGQLFRQGLVTDRKELHKRRPKGNIAKGRRPKGGTPWTDQEIEKLQDLYFEFASEESPLTEIASRLTTKNIDEIAEKLQDLGLMETSDSAVPDIDGLPNTDDELNDESSPCDESDDGDDGISGVDRRQPVLGQARVDRPNREPRMPAANCVEFVEQLRDKGFSPALEWLAESLEGEAEDRTRDDEWENLPIVPVSPANDEAVKDHVFLQLLEGLGMRPPVDSQEQHWRIPSDMTPGELRHVVRTLRTARLPTPILPVDIPEADTLHMHNSEQSSSKRMTPSVAKRKAALSDFIAQKVKKVGKKKTRPGKDRGKGMFVDEEEETSMGTEVGKKKRKSLADFVGEAVTDDDDDEIGGSSQNSPTSETKRKRVHQLSDDDSTTEIDHHQSPQEKTKSQDHGSSKRRRQLIDDDSDVEIEGHKEQAKAAKPIVDSEDSSSDSDVDIERPKKLVIIESDGDD